MAALVAHDGSWFVIPAPKLAIPPFHNEKVLPPFESMLP
jgi:hypothetical protein